jgi:hypothetical protein
MTLPFSLERGKDNVSLIWHKAYDELPTVATPLIQMLSSKEKRRTRRAAWP